MQPMQLLGGRYRLVRPLREGARGQVWVAEHLALGSLVAVKLIDRRLAEGDDGLEHFRSEASAAAALRSPHVVQVLDHGVADDQPFIVMELLDGEDLEERLRHRWRLTLEQTKTVV